MLLMQQKISANKKYDNLCLPKVKGKDAHHDYAFSFFVKLELLLKLLCNLLLQN